MNFGDAWRALQDGHRVARASWVEPGKYVYRIPGGRAVLPGGREVEQTAIYLFYRPAKGDGGLVEPYAPLADALEARDWYVVTDD
ncbi:MW1434 family type I TA system toxin [Streptomyces sp. TRM70308]|uniref:Thoeris anti-defense Tad2 family protein n=1 Tax=Streptomyces sp. TRM70308 TaxID=3131932 RepID=UPI003CFC5F63